MTEHASARFKALLVEGVPGIGKSTVVDAMIRRYINSAGPRKIRTFVHLSQTYTYGPLAPAEDAGPLTVADNMRLLEHVAGLLEWLYADLGFSDKQSFVLIDCLHLTHCLRPGVLTWPEALAIDRRLAAANCKLLLLRATPETIWSRSIQAQAGSQFLEYARKFGRTDAELHRHFVAEQEQLLGMFEQSAMMRTAIQNDGELRETVDQAYGFWLGTRT
jgi:hypothetical protein